jgi:polyhydroxyalkanoate synthase
VLVFGGANDAIAPIEAVKAAVPMLSSSPEARFEIVPGGHLGMLTGRKARTSTWPVIDAWVDQWTEHRDEPPAPARSATSRRTTMKAARKTAGRTPTDKPDETPTLGANPTRRYGSADSRALRR